MVASVKRGVGIVMVEVGWDVITGKVVGREIGIEAGGGEGALDRTGTYGVGEQERVSP